MNKNSEKFVSQIQKAIEEIFKKAPRYEKTKIEFYGDGGMKSDHGMRYHHDSHYVSIENNIKVGISIIQELDKQTQFSVKLVIPGVQNYFTCLFIDNELGKELEGCRVSSEADKVFKSCVYTMITRN